MINTSTDEIIDDPFQIDDMPITDPTRRPPDISETIDEEHLEIVKTGLLTEMKTYYRIVSRKIPRELGAMEEAGLRRGQILARSSSILSDVQQILDYERGRIADDLDFIKKTKHSTTLLNILLDNETRTTKRLFSMAKKLNDTCAAQMDVLRTLIATERKER